MNEFTSGYLQEVRGDLDGPPCKCGAISDYGTGEYKANVERWRAYLVLPELRSSGELRNRYEAIVSAEPNKVHRQGKGNPKTRYHIRWDNGIYDYLLKRAQREGISVAALLNQIIRRERRNVPQETFEAS